MEIKNHTNRDIHLNDPGGFLKRNLQGRRNPMRHLQGEAGPVLRDHPARLSHGWSRQRPYTNFFDSFISFIYVSHPFFYFLWLQMASDLSASY